MGRPGGYVINFRRRDDWEWNSVCVHVWGAAFAAKKYIEAVIREDEWCWDVEDNGSESNDRLFTETGIVVETGASASRGMLRRAMDHEYSLPEMAWSLPVPYPKMAAAWRSRQRWESTAVLVERKVRSTPRALRQGMTSVQTIADELGITPREARGALRKAKVPKPPCGWAWKSDEISDVRSLIARLCGKEVA